MANELKQLAIALAERSQNITDASELLAVAAAIKNLEENIINVVPTYADLPPIQTVSPGSVWLVENEETVYFKKKDEFYSQVEYQNLLYAWGRNDYATLGIGAGPDFNFCTPERVKFGGIKDWTDVSAGCDNAIALRKDGTLWSWGYNNYGQLGLGCNGGYVSFPEQIGNFTWCKVCVGTYTSAAIKDDGSLWGWGKNDYEQLGVSNEVSDFCDQPTQELASDFFINVLGCQISACGWTDVAVGGFHTVALQQNGTLWSWGLNSCGQLGNNESISIADKGIVVGGFTDWCQVSAGEEFTVAIRTNGTLWAWGLNYSGQLGDGTYENRSSPVLVTGENSWSQVSAGTAFTLAITTNNRLWGWGSNDWGQLGINYETESEPVPVQVVGGFTDWCQVSAGDDHAAAIRTNGTLWAWGRNWWGKLGDGSGYDRSSPVEVFGGYTDWVKVSANKTNGATFAIRVQ